MRSNMVGVVAALAFGGLVACSTWATAQDADAGQKGGKRGFSVEQQLDRIAEQVNLTAEQKPKVKAILEESAKKRQELFRDSSVPQDQRREKMQALIQEQDKKLKAILKPEQFEKWQKAREQMRQGRPEGAKRGEGRKNN